MLPLQTATTTSSYVYDVSTAATAASSYGLSTGAGIELVVEGILTQAWYNQQRSAVGGPAGHYNQPGAAAVIQNAMKNKVKYDWWWGRSGDLPMLRRQPVNIPLVCCSGCSDCMLPSEADPA